MAYGNQRGSFGGRGGGGWNRGNRGGGGGGNRGDNTRLTGLFPSRNRRGLHVGGIKFGEIEGIRSLLKKAIAEEKGLTFFLWRNDEDRGGPPYTLTAMLAQEERDGSRGEGRRISADDRPAPRRSFGPSNDDGPDAADTPDL